MCGIVGYIGERQASPILLEGLRRLEYRGYDSAGVVLIRGGELLCRKKKGKIDEGLARLLDARPLEAHVDTPAGPLMAGRLKRTPIRTVTAAARLLSFTTG